MPLLEEGPFLLELNKLYEKHKSSGSVWVTMKRTNLRRAAAARAAAAEGGAADGGPGDDFRCLVRATDGSRKFSTALTGKQLPRFLASYTVMQRAHFDALKKAVPKKAEAKAAAKKRALGTRRGG